MARLADITKLIRSKNAGPFLITFDILFGDEKTLQHVVESGVITAELFAKLYQTPVQDVQFSIYPPGFAIKATIPRRIYSGDVGDSDIYGGQMYAPLVGLEIP
jgi:hypothetical protein